VFNEYIHNNYMGMPALLAFVENILGSNYVEDQPFLNNLLNELTYSKPGFHEAQLTYITIHTFGHTAIILSVYPTFSDFLS